MQHDWAERQAEATNNLREILVDFQDAIPPHTFDEIAALGAQAITTAINWGLVEPESHAAAMVAELSHEARVHLFFQILVGWLDIERDEPNRAGKAALLDLFEVMGPDYAQAFYRFAVLFTKLV